MDILILRRKESEVEQVNKGGRGGPVGQKNRGLRGQRERCKGGQGGGRTAEEQVVFQSKNRYNCYRRVHSVQSIVAPFFMLSQRRS